MTKTLLKKMMTEVLINAMLSILNAAYGNVEKELPNRDGNDSSN
jgi:hypothetical protein